ncbi:hypothetical protein W909_05615 [Dickeya zeae EC1]|nr:hypothetical protein W909_05615 [Dickeya zeae EC1]
MRGGLWFADAHEYRVGNNQEQNNQEKEKVQAPFK